MRHVGVLLAPLAWVGCLPTDTRPPPAEVTVTTSSSAFTLGDSADAVSADGYTLTFDLLLVSLGQVDVGNSEGVSGCNEYSNPDYTRLFDFKQVTAPEELGLAYATGRCDFGFSVRFPDELTLIDVGATADEAILMRLPGSDRVSTDSGVSAYVEGTAVRGAVHEHFAWPFRKRIRYSGCEVPDDAGNLEAGLSLTSGGKAGVNLEVHAEALFQDPASASVLFEPFAQADANNDGEIDFDELWTVPIADVIAAGFEPPPPSDELPPSQPVPGAPPPDPALSCYDADGNLITIATLGDYSYCKLLPNLVRYQGTGVCTTMAGRANHD
jgi:hypothetical protein